VEIETRDLQKRYGGDVHALTAVSLAVRGGEIVAVTGPSGSGKSTLLSVLGTLECATSGEVRADGKALTAYRPLERFRAERIGFIFQFHHLIPCLTLLENVELPMVALGVGRRQRRSRAADLLARVGLEDRAEFFPARVSGGERQRCAVARALVNTPDLVLADEPTGNLDSVTGERVMDFMLDWARDRGATVVMATHNPEIAAKAGRRLQIRDGRVREEQAD